MFDLDAAWRLHPQAALRPESFGALLYHFGTRKLSFLKDRTVVRVVTALPEYADARTAMRAVGLDDDDDRYLAALTALAESHFLVRAS